MTLPVFETTATALREKSKLRRHFRRFDMLFYLVCTVVTIDTIGAVATVANLPDGMTTTTIESKTNFFSGIALGDTARAECTPLHKGRTTMVWQTKITRGDGKLAALVTQTQLVMPKR